MGVVYKAIDTKLSRTVALKFLPLDADAPDSARSSLLEEARAASALDHPNIGTIHGIEEGPGGRIFIVMACYEGITLTDKIRQGSLSPKETASIGIQMARGLAEAHAHNIVHRDIKPSNAILTTQGLVKIVDFGLARVISSASATQTARIAGTAVYMSPEQAQGKMLDRRTDLWSLGVVLYEMATGHQPFQGQSVPTTLYAIVHSPPAPLDESVPRELQLILYRALAKNPEARYQSAAQMLAALEAIDSASTPAASPTITIRDLARYRQLASQADLPQAQQSRRAVWKWAAGALAIAALPLLGLLYAPFRQRAAPLIFGSPQRHIAVLPISAIGNDPANTALAEGLLESLTSRLSNLEVGNQSLWVVPASEVRRRKISDAVAAQKEFGANLVITGAVQRQGNLVRLTVNLIDAKSVRQIGSGEFEDRTGDFSVLQDSAVAKLANLMKISVTPDMLRNTGGSVRPAAYESYLKALGYLQRYDKPGNLDQAVSLLSAAVREDPNFALAFESLGEAYLIKYKDDRNPRWIDQASANCKHALALNDRLSPVYTTLGRILDATGQHDLALDQFQRALMLEPRSAEALAGQAAVYETQGRLKEAEESFRRASALRPDYWDGYSKLALFYFRQRRFPGAVQAFKRVVDLTPDNAEAYSNLGVVYRRMGNLPDAAQVFRKAIGLAPTYRFYSNLGLVYHDQKNYAGAAAMFQKAVALNDKDFRVWMNIASAERWLGHGQKVMDAYARALPLVQDLATRQPQDPLIQSTLGLLYARFQQRDKAIPRLEAGVALAPKDPGVLERTAGAYEALGDRRAAIQWLARAIKAGGVIEQIEHNPELRAVLADPNFKRATNK